MTDDFIFVSFSILIEGLSGRSSVVERLLAKQKAVGSSPIARSRTSIELPSMDDKARYPSG